MLRLVLHSWRAEFSVRITDLQFDATFFHFSITDPFWYAPTGIDLVFPFREEAIPFLELDSNGLPWNPEEVELSWDWTGEGKLEIYLLRSTARDGSPVPFRSLTTWFRMGRKGEPGLVPSSFLPRGNRVMLKVRGSGILPSYPDSLRELIVQLMERVRGFLSGLERGIEPVPCLWHQGSIRPVAVSEYLAALAQNRAAPYTPIQVRVKKTRDGWVPQFCFPLPCCQEVLEESRNLHNELWEHWRSPEHIEAVFGPEAAEEFRALWLLNNGG